MGIAIPKDYFDSFRSIQKHPGKIIMINLASIPNFTTVGSYLLINESHKTSLCAWCMLQLDTSTSAVLTNENRDAASKASVEEAATL